MKNRLSTIASLALIAASLLIGMVVANYVQPNANQPNASQPNASQSERDQQADRQPTNDQSNSATSWQTAAAGGAVASDSSLETSSPTSSQYVQDPPQRSASRPDFSSGLRRSNQRSNFFMLRAFHDAIGESWKSTVRMTVSGEQVALGAIVGSDGWIVTKASELPTSGGLVCQLYDGGEYDANVVTTVVDLDLALVQIQRSELPVVSWDSSDIPPRGRWLATTDAKAGIPSAVGVVSAGAQSVTKERAVLGVNLAYSAEGASVTGVLRGTGAEEAGLRVGDNISSVNGRDVFNHEDFKKAVQDSIGGQMVKLSVNRADKTFETQGRLMDLAIELQEETEMEVNGHVSARATGFERVFMHDTVLEPNQCGGPLVNLDGNVVGINIARAGRVSSYALPADVVKPVVEGLIAQAKLVSRPVDTQSALRPIR